MSVRAYRRCTMLAAKEEFMTVIVRICLLCWSLALGLTAYSQSADVPPELVAAHAVAPLQATHDWPAWPHASLAVPARQTPSWQQPEQLKTLQCSSVPQPARSAAAAARARMKRAMCDLLE